MAETQHIAKILGPTLVALSTSEAANPHIWTGVPATQVYLAGSLWLVAGLSIVCTHNRWSDGWAVLVTFMGWFAIVGGLFRMFAPEFAQSSVPSPFVLLAIQAVLFAIGAVITYKGFRHAND